MRIAIPNFGTGPVHATPIAPQRNFGSNPGTPVSRFTPFQKSQYYRDFNLGTANTIPRLRQKSYEDGFATAYTNKSGYSIKNIDGHKVMFVSGSRNATDWILNMVGDPFTPSGVQVFSNRTARRLDRIAKANKVDHVLGHSRGGMLISKMKYGKASIRKPTFRSILKRFGPGWSPNTPSGPRASTNKVAYTSVDGAMILAPRNRRDTLNVYQRYGIDPILGISGRRNRSVGGTWMNTHFLYKDRSRSY